MKHIKHMISNQHIDFSLLAICITLNFIIIYTHQLISNLPSNMYNIIFFITANIALIMYKKLFILPNKFLEYYLYFISLFSIVIFPSFILIKAGFYTHWQLYFFIKLYILYVYIKYKFPVIIFSCQILIITLLYLISQNICFIYHLSICVFFISFNEFLFFYQSKKKQVIPDLKIEFQHQDITKIESNKLEQSLKTAYKLIHIISNNIIKHIDIIDDHLNDILKKTPKFLNIKHSSNLEQIHNNTMLVSNLKNNIEVIYDNILNHSNLNFSDLNFKKLLYLCIENAFTKKLMLNKGILFDIKYKPDCTNYINCDSPTMEKAINYLLDFTTKQAKKNTIVEIVIYSTIQNQLCINISYQIDSNIINYIFNKTNFTISDVDCNEENIDLYISNMLLESNFGHLLIKQNKQANHQCLEIMLPIKNTSPNINASFKNKNNKLPVVLCIDDDQNTLNCLEFILEDSYQLICFDSPVSALSYLENPDNFIDILLIDLMMPEMYGINLINEIKNNDLAKNIPIILNSCSSDYNEIRKAFELGITDFIQKPFNKNELLTKLGLLLKK